MLNEQETKGKKCAKAIKQNQYTFPRQRERKRKIRQKKLTSSGALHRHLLYSNGEKKNRPRKGLREKTSSHIEQVDFPLVKE